MLGNINESVYDEHVNCAGKAWLRYPVILLSLAIGKHYSSVVCDRPRVPARGALCLLHLTLRPKEHVDLHRGAA
jgi:hypothetical protein